jgi:hypothetical protein
VRTDPALQRAASHVARFSPVGVFRGQISSSSHLSSLVVMGLVSLVVAAAGYTLFARRDA